MEGVSGESSGRLGCLFSFVWYWDRAFLRAVFVICALDGAACSGRSYKAAYVLVLVFSCAT